MPFEPRFKTLVALFDHAVREYGARDLFGVKSGGSWGWTTYAEFASRVGRMRRGLAVAGIERGDRVAMVSNNRVEWAVVAYACYGLGAVFVPMYEAQSIKELEFIVRDCGAKVVFLSGRSNVTFAKARALLDAGASRVVLLDSAHDRDGEPDTDGGASTLGRPYGEPSERMTTYARLLGTESDVGVPSSIDPSPDDTATLIYTSGTTGTPKGVVLTHGNVSSNVSSVHAVFHFSPDDRSLAFLPWAHVFGQTAELHLLISFGASMAICEGPDRILENLAEVRPTLLFSVPRVFNRIYMAVQQQLAGKPKLVQKAVSLALAAAAKERAGERLKLHEMALRKVVDRLVFDKVRARFGGRLRFTVSGSAALSVEVAEFVDSLGILVYEGYGLTETSPVVSVNFPGARRMGTVGRALPGVRVRIDEPTVASSRAEGEIIVYGPNVMKGYYNHPAETAAAFTADGGLRTGDIGCVDAEGFLSITGRIKEQYKLENGKYVVPTPLEDKLKLSPFIANAMVYGDNRPFNVAVVVANLSALATWAQNEHVTLPKEVDARLADDRVRALFVREVERCGVGLKSYEAIREFALIGEDFTTENDMLTPSLKLKRRRILEVHAHRIEQLYARSAPRAQSGVGVSESRP